MKSSRCGNEPAAPQIALRATALAVSLLCMAPLAFAQKVDAQSGESGNVEQVLDTVQVTGNWLGTGLQNSVKTFPGARTVVGEEQIEQSGASSISDVMRRIPGVQSTDNSGTSGSAISLNIGVRGLTGRYSPRSTVLLDGIPMAVAPYGQPQLSFAPVSLGNIDSIDVVRSGGAVRYGPQNVGGIINFNTRPIPTSPGITGDASIRENIYTEGGGSNTQYNAFVGTTLDSGLGLAVLYSGMTGREWRKGSDDDVNDLAVKFAYDINNTSQVYGKVSYYDVRSRTPGGLTVAQYNADPFQNTRPNDYWSGNRTAFDLGYVNTISGNQEFEIRTFFNESYRQSTLQQSATVIAHQPRNYTTFGIEPRYTQRLALGPTTHDITVGYRYIRERGDDNAFNQNPRTGVVGPTTTFDNATDAHAVYIDDRIAVGNWRIVPGVRFEHIDTTRQQRGTTTQFDSMNNKALPSINVSYLVNNAWTVFTDYSTSFGPVQNTQLNSQTPSNPLQPEVARTFEVGTRWTDNRIKAELTAFKIKFDNQIQQVPGLFPATFQNIGATDHDGVETAIDYTFDRASVLGGLNVYANYTYTRAIQKSGATAGMDVPFYSRNTDTIGARYNWRNWTFNASTTHQSAQYSDLANTIAESADGSVGRIPGFRTWNLQAMFTVPQWKRTDITIGINNLFDKRYYTRTTDSNAGRLVGAPRMVYIQARAGF
ncbi:TonB-dependent receptor family protein [Cupriavidus pinatubonensis]|uniref:TonB-dependent receptor family protein n=1 Tax=Cupriavidus pinatubonensis TaxID=248026 RepID=UPI0011299DEF|nr:TonB-dependent siderophore receptor [Cupriavidus pinatubonensis]TPQ32931.1 TonB-dependent siderophore receptor [Cupriavidus pinatubonensis]